MGYEAEPFTKGADILQTFIDLTQSEEIEGEGGSQGGSRFPSRPDTGAGEGGGERTGAPMGGEGGGGLEGGGDLGFSRPGTAE